MLPSSVKRDILTPMKDKTTKILLLAIALGLWANALLPVLRPLPVRADDLGDIYSTLKSMKSDLSGINSGLCLNSKIC